MEEKSYVNARHFDVFQQATLYMFKAQYGQVDKVGDPYYLHTLRVALMGKTHSERIVGLLHDVVEDGGVNGVRPGMWRYDLLDIGVTTDEIYAIDALTKRKGGTLEYYLRRVMANPLALAVKKNDMADNTAPWRIQRLAKKDPEAAERLRKKYGEYSRILYGLSGKNGVHVILTACDLCSDGICSACKDTHGLHTEHTDNIVTDAGCTFINNKFLKEDDKDG